MLFVGCLWSFKVNVSRAAMEQAAQVALQLRAIPLGLCFCSFCARSLQTCLPSPGGKTPVRFEHVNPFDCTQVLLETI